MFLFMQGIPMTARYINNKSNVLFRSLSAEGPGAKLFAVVGAPAVHLQTQQPDAHQPQNSHFP